MKKVLKPGDKVKNQVNVPDWIKKNREYRISCLRGLLDTDGSIYIRNTQKSFGINFKNGSLPLANDFKEMCESLDIKTQKIPKPKIYHYPKTDKISKVYQVNIEDKFQISKLLYLVKPKKWDYHAKTLGMVLLSHKDPKKRAIIKNRLDIIYPDKKIHYTKEYADILKKLCEEQGYTLNNNTIVEAIKFALCVKNKRIQLNHYGKKLIEDLKNRLEEKSYSL